MNLRFFAIMWVSFIPVLNFSCGSPQIKDEKTLQKNHEAALKGDRESLKNYDKALETPESEKTPELHEKIIDDLAKIPGKDSEDILKKHAEDESANIRGKSVSALYVHHDVTDNPKTLEKDTINIIKKNQENYKELTPQEIQTLGSIKSNDAADILVDELNKSNQKDPSAILDTLGSKLTKKKNELKELDLPENLNPDKKTETENEAQKIETSFLEFIKSDHPQEQKERALQTLYSSYGDNSNVKFVQLYKNPEMNEENKILILKFLSSKPGTEKEELINTFKKDYMMVKTNEDKQVIYTRLEAITPDQAKSIQESLDKEIQDREKQIQTKSEMRQLAKKNQIVMLKDLLKKYNVPSNIVDRMQAQTYEIALDRTTPMRAESVIVISCIQEIFPSKNYFEIQKIAEKGLYLPGLFYLILNAIDSGYESVDMKLLAVQSVWKLSATDAARIYQAYSKEKQLLKEMLH